MFNEKNRNYIFFLGDFCSVRLSITIRKAFSGEGDTLYHLPRFCPLNAL